MQSLLQSLLTLFTTLSVAAAAKKVEEAPAPGIVDTVLGFVPSWLGGPVAQVLLPSPAPFALRAVRTIGVTDSVEWTRN